MLACLTNSIKHLLLVFLRLFTLEVEFFQLFTQWFQIGIASNILEAAEFLFLALYPLADTIKRQFQMLNTRLFNLCRTTGLTRFLIETIPPLLPAMHGFFRFSMGDSLFFITGLGQLQFRGDLL